MKEKLNPCDKCEDDAKYRILTANGIVNACVCKKKDRYDKAVQKKHPYVGWRSITEFIEYMR